MSNGLREAALVTTKKVFSYVMKGPESLCGTKKVDPSYSDATLPALRPFVELSRRARACWAHARCWR